MWTQRLAKAQFCQAHVLPVPLCNFLYPLLLRLLLLATSSALFNVNINQQAKEQGDGQTCSCTGKSSPQPKHRLSCLQDYFIFCAGHLVLQIASFSLCFLKADSRTLLRDNPEDTFQRVVDIFIAAWPMSVPTVLFVALAVRVAKLHAEGIDTLQPDKLIAAAHVEAVCFDKTGTLTANTVRYLLCLCFSHSINQEGPFCPVLPHT